MNKITRKHFHRNLSTETLVSLLGQEVLDRLERENCDFTGRVSAELDCSNLIEFSASIKVNIDLSHLEFLENSMIVTAYYYQDKDLVKGVEDLGILNWKIDHVTLT